MSRVFSETITHNNISLGPNNQNQSWNMFNQKSGSLFDLVAQETISGIPIGPMYSLINYGSQGSTGFQGEAGFQGPIGNTGIAGPFINNSVLFNNSGITGSSNLTFSSNNLSVTGNVQLSGISSNLIRRANNVVPYDVKVTLDDISAEVESFTQKLKVTLNSGSWQATGWTQTFDISSLPSIQNWVNLPISFGFSNASGSLGNRGYGCKMVFGDQTPGNNTYEIIVINLTGTRFSITIERLV